MPFPPSQPSTSQVLEKAVTVIQGSEEHAEEKKDMEQGMDEGLRATSPGEGTESPAHALHSPTADASALMGTAK